MKKSYKMFAGFLALTFLAACGEKPDQKKIEGFHDNLTILEMKWRRLCFPDITPDQPRAVASPACTTGLVKTLDLANGLPPKWVQKNEAAKAANVPTSWPIQLVSEWGTQILIGGTNSGLMVRVDDVPAADCPLLTESMSVRAKEVELNATAIPKSVNGSAHQKAKEICRDSGQNTLEITL